MEDVNAWFVWCLTEITVNRARLTCSRQGTRYEIWNERGEWGNVNILSTEISIHQIT